MYSKNSQLSTREAFSEMEFIYPQESENKILDALDDSYKKVSEMSLDERAFLNALILRNKPSKLLEIGVSSGGSSIVMLNAIKDFQGAKLYSIDLYDNLYKEPGLKTGYFVDNYPLLKRQWELFTGGLALNFMDRIGSEIDFVFIDTVHYNPGEILDFLMVLPFLKYDAVIVFHDVKMHTFSTKNKDAITNNLLISSISGRKYLQGNFVKNDKHIFPNIAGIKVQRETKLDVFSIFNLMTIKWAYLPSVYQKKEIFSWFEKYYGDIHGGYYMDYLKDVFVYQEKQLSSNSMYNIKTILKRIIGLENIQRMRKIIKKQ